MKSSIVVLTALLVSFVSFNGFSQEKSNKVLTAKQIANLLDSLRFARLQN